MQIWVDADACPAAIKEILYRAADRARVRVTLVANQSLRIPVSPYIRFTQVRCRSRRRRSTHRRVARGGRSGRDRRHSAGRCGHRERRARVESARRAVHDGQHPRATVDAELHGRAARQRRADRRPGGVESTRPSGICERAGFVSREGEFSHTLPSVVSIRFDPLAFCPTAGGQKNRAGARQTIAVLVIARAERTLRRGSVPQHSQGPLDICEAHAESVRNVGRREQMTGRQRGVGAGTYPAGSRSARAARRLRVAPGLAVGALERVGAKCKARSPRDDTHCALQLFIQTDDECSQRAVQIAKDTAR